MMIRWTRPKRCASHSTVGPLVVRIKRSSVHSDQVCQDGAMTPLREREHTSGTENSARACIIARITGSEDIIKIDDTRQAI